MADSPQLRIGTRASALARWQAEWVSAQLAAAGDMHVELVPISTQGDRQQTGPISQLGTQGVFTKEIQRALLEGQIDVAVHSLKDLPTEGVAELTLAAVPERASSSDALVCRAGMSWEQLPPGARIGTGSLRRRAQLLHARADLTMCDVRGNVDTRLRKLDAEEYDALVLAEAGLARLGLADRITLVFPPSIMVGAVGQGALAIECRADDDVARGVLARLDHGPSHTCIDAERALLAKLHGGCSAPIAGAARMQGDELELVGLVLSVSGEQRLSATATATPQEAVVLGNRVADDLLSQGAAELIRQGRTSG